MSQARVTIQFAVPAGYIAGDYAMLCSSSGPDAIDYNNPLSSTKYQLLPDGRGIKGFGLAPFGEFPFGLAYSDSARGFGQLPFGQFPFGLGTELIIAEHTISECGDHTFALACYDAAGNPHSGSPEEVTFNIHIPPDDPAALKPTSYDPATDILVLTAA